MNPFFVQYHKKLVYPYRSKLNQQLVLLKK